MNSQIALDRCLVLIFAVLTTGCGGNHSDKVPVMGTVSYRGELLAKAALTFFPESGRPTTVAVDSTGAYTAELSPGDYDVIVSLSANVPPGWREGDPLPPPNVVLPTEYSTRAKTTLKATVTQGRAELIDFDLK